MSNPRYNKSKRLTSESATILEMGVDLAIFTRKYTPPFIAKQLGMSRQSLDQHIVKKLGGKK